MRRFLNLIDWSLLFAPLQGCEEMWNTFIEAVHTGLDILMPEKQCRFCTADAPWMTQRVKALILQRQKCFNIHGPSPLNLSILGIPLTGRGKRVEPDITNQRYNN